MDILRPPLRPNARHRRFRHVPSLLVDQLGVLELLAERHPGWRVDVDGNPTALHLHGASVSATLVHIAWYSQ